MMGRYVLPWFGGGPAVWTNCLLFFQALLLAGYAYAHWLGSRRSLRLQAGTHIALLGGLASVSSDRPARRYLESVGKRRPLRPDPASAGRNGRRTVSAAVGHRSASAALVHAERAGESAVAAVRAVEPRIVSGAAQLSFRDGTLPAPSHAGLDLVGAVRRLRGAVRMDGMAAPLPAAPPGRSHGGIRPTAHIVDDAVLAGALGVRLDVAAGHHQPALSGNCGQSIPLGRAPFHLPAHVHSGV